MPTLASDPKQLIKLFGINNFFFGFEIKIEKEEKKTHITSLHFLSSYNVYSLNMD